MTNRELWCANYKEQIKIQKINVKNRQKKRKMT